MQVVILAAGKGTRMGALTEEIPKPLLRVGEDTLLEQKFSILPEGTEEVIVTIGYLGERIREHLGSAYRGVPIRYIEDPERSGTAGTLWKARNALHGAFVVLAADDLYQKRDIDALARHEHAVLGKHVAQITPGDYLDHDDAHTVTDVLSHTEYEAQAHTRRLPINTSAFKLTPRIFEFPLVEYKPGEYGLPHTLIAAVKRGELSLRVHATEAWHQVNTPEQLAEAERLYAQFST
ncbi:NTP transferase domain-containing protein [Patescibacteria group bacterium]|jgi:bifunctional UDP-N-acetylglucosamine pyrophosphorylase/glucosamine-1-phosphate N-acetyltransferase|nr:NTP transferase domain-containing protein [Patescibacteria group bacterium]